MNVTVIGAGVIGLSVAHELASGGHRVRVVADASAIETVSGVAAAVWFPYETEHSEAATGWAMRTLERLTALADDPATGVVMRWGTVIERRADPDRDWVACVPKHREASPTQLPAGATSGVRALLPVVTMPRYLPWLVARCHELGVHFEHRTIRDLDEFASGEGRPDLVVVAAGLRAGSLLDDDSMRPIRGQVVRLANTGLTEWMIDDDNPGGKRYVFPRHDDVVCGGTADVGVWDDRVDPATEADILTRVAELVPALRGQPIVSRAAGLRPWRATIRLEPVAGYGVPVIACYGHGGAGVTLSWGCAEGAAELAALADSH